MDRYTRFSLRGSEIVFIRRGWFNCNSILLVGGAGPVLVDTGHVAGAAETLALVRGASVDAADLRLIVNTHCHWDHFGGTQTLQAVSGAPLATSAATADIFARNDRRAMWPDYFGVDVTPPTADVCWQDGDVVELGGLPFTVLAAPGHAPDAIALYQPEMALLVSADALHERDCGVLNVAVHGEGVVDAAAATIERFAALPLDVVLPGHGPVIDDPADSLTAVAQRLAQFRRDPRELIGHFARRVTMAALMELQPVSCSDFLALVQQDPWVADYAPRFGYSDGERFLRDRLDEFLARDLVYEDDGLLRSRVPR